MRFPSFIKVPRHRRFEIEPRYYDPVKEEIEERTARIKQEMSRKSTDDGPEYQGNYTPGRISFERTTRSAPSASFLQLLIAAALGIMIFGWLYVGNQIFYAMWLVIPIYLYFRFKKPTSRSSKKQ